MKKTIVFSFVLFLAASVYAFAQVNPNDTKEKEGTVQKKEDNSKGKVVVNSKSEKKVVAKDSAALKDATIKAVPEKKSTVLTPKAKTKTSPADKKSSEKVVVPNDKKP